ncbi:acyltransferase family protein [Prevotella sp. AGR2160]|uniref:acyltransferase family protein n=1 Tax=Prevotella sp. AGR2160 TaxID=1280674 RepID=UPI00068455A3|nr:acyltransferase family protein [Prevotella sp. AGR2160]
MTQSHPRIFYIDALKAFAILLVVLGHEPLFSPVDDQVWQFVGIFHMPLFMAVSGIVTNPEKIHLPKRAKMLIPFLIFGIGFTFLMGGTFLSFITSEPKGGYWYLYVLFVFCLLLAACRKLPWRLEVGMILIQAFLMALHLAFHSTITGETLSTDHMFQLWPFFCLGIFFRRGLLEWLQKREVPVMALSVLVVIILGWGG